MSKFTIDYFINKVEATTEENWTTGEMGENGCHCMLGHMGVDWDFIHNEESATLTNMMLEADPDTKHIQSLRVNNGDSFSVYTPIMDFNDNLKLGEVRQNWLNKLNEIKETLK